MQPVFPNPQSIQFTLQPTECDIITSCVSMSILSSELFTLLLQKGNKYPLQFTLPLYIHPDIKRNIVQVVKKYVDDLRGLLNEGSVSISQFEI